MHIDVMWCLWEYAILKAQVQVHQGTQGTKVLNVHHTPGVSTAQASQLDRYCLYFYIALQELSTKYEEEMQKQEEWRRQKLQQDAAAGR